mgnify:CR=1 FL=1
MSLFRCAIAAACSLQDSNCGDLHKTHHGREHDGASAVASPLPPINPSIFITHVVCCLFSVLPGYGITCVLQDGNLLEKAAANISVVRGTLTAARAQAMSSRGRSTIDPAGGQPYSAAALSLVFHSAHPMVPTLRADVRLFQVCLLFWVQAACCITPHDATSSLQA